MYRSVLALLFTMALLLGGCAAQQQTVPKEKSGRETNMGGAAFDRSDEEITYMDSGRYQGCCQQNVGTRDQSVGNEHGS